MATFTVVPIVTDPLTQKLQGVIYITPGDTYIIDPTVGLRQRFLLCPYWNAGWIDSQLQCPDQRGEYFDGHRAADHHAWRQYHGEYHRGGAGVNAGRYDFAGTTVDGANYTIGAGATIGDLQLGDGGSGSLTTVTSSVTLGDGATVAGQINGGAGAGYQLLKHRASLVYGSINGFPWLIVATVG